ncbi:hypothetical protein [Rheinheimera pleomorphica]|uniref:hypothetical protein n=1 Tax=Rheinheimera pleomorphica TaxID=2703963 RepID=UPI0014233E0D|nr:hypothetical protein [Rheinheimera pleomorphica]
MRIKNLSIISVGGNKEACTVEISESPPWVLVFNSEAFGTIQCGGVDLFECLISLRRILEKRGFNILCQGARSNVISSRMTKQMSGGRLAYLTQMGEPAKEANLVDIFEPALETDIGSIEEQKTYQQSWLDMFSK